MVRASHANIAYPRLEEAKERPTSALTLNAHSFLTKSPQGMSQMLTKATQLDRTPLYVIAGGRGGSGDDGGCVVRNFLFVPVYTIEIEYNYGRTSFVLRRDPKPTRVLRKT